MPADDAVMVADGGRVRGFRGRPGVAAAPEVAVAGQAARCHDAGHPAAVATPPLEPDGERLVAHLEGMTPWDS